MSSPVGRFDGVAALPGDLGPTVVTVGMFDGVHRGHRALLDRVAGEAAARDLPAAAVTFDRHPLAVLRPGSEPPLLTTLDRKVELLAEAGMRAVLVLEFTRELSEVGAEAFAAEVLFGSLAARAVVVGENFRFGHKAAGHVDTLVAAGATYGFQVEGLSLAGLSLTGDGQPWSSTYIRGRIADGDVEAAAEALGRPLRVTGVVVEGDKRGRELGFPTANIPADPRAAIPLDGVYAGWLTVLDPAEGAPAYPDRLPAAISVGSNPTFDGVDRRVETYVLDRDDLELYGARIAVDFVARLRGSQIRFDSIDELLVQMKADVDGARHVLIK